ncbi:apoptosis facilitator Bcl-2-like protein 14 [Nematolebias whitei]|uniref:apoptosis facilitator Bcl-2-like protein 14 n=1 Tax=Nematolebias whitei TaxID=451745 RepID=UPI00189A29C1|nr:apoptosis facilitator Bcl-2-like protein 14 [Nematolebias whitei]
MESPQEASEVLQLLEDYCTRRSRWRSAGASQWRTLRRSRMPEEQNISSLPDVPPLHSMMMIKVPVQHPKPAQRRVTERLVEITESAPIRKDEVQTQEEIIQKLVQLVIMFGDDINAKLKQNPVLKEQLQNLNYKTFEKLTSTVQNLVAPAGQATGPDCQVEQQKIAWAFEVTSRLSAVGVVHHRRVLNFGAQYIEQNHADWVWQRGGWEEAFDID